MNQRVLINKAAVFLCFSLISAVTSFAETTSSSLESYMRKFGFGVIPLERSKQNKLFLRADLDGKSTTMFVDSGWSITALDSSVASRFKTTKELNVTYKDPLLDGFDTGSLVLFRMKIGGAKFENQPGMSVPLKAQGMGSGGVIGCDFMIRNNAFLDCGAKRLYVRSAPLTPDLREKLEKTMAGSGYAVIPFARAEGLVPICEAKINDVTVKLVVDSGGVWTMLDDSTARKLKLLLSKTGVWVAGVEREMKSELLTAPVKSILLGDSALPLKGLLIGVGDLNAWIPKGASHHTDGILGAELLAQSWALLDFQTNKLWFVPESRK